MKMSALICLLLAVFAVAYLNLPKFGHLPDEISREKIKLSPNFKNGHFENLHPTEKMTGEKNFFLTMVDFYFGNHPDTKPKKEIPTIKTNLKELNPNEDLLVWFGHSSYYFQLNGKRYLVDPVFNDNASPIPYNVVPFKGTNIYKPEDMPEIDYLLITHDHYDHLDYETIKALEPKVKHVISGLGVGSHLRYWGYDNQKITELDWFEHINTPESVITALPARHFSGRSLFKNPSLWASYIIKTPTYTLYIGGDSGYDDHYKTIGEKFPKIDLALMEAGQYDNNWRYIHEHPDQVIQAATDLGVRKMIPIHNSKFSICNHPWFEPLDKITELGQNAPFDILTPKIGEVVNLRNNSQTFEPWWKDIK